MTNKTPDQTKYETLLDREVWSFIDRSNSFFPVDAANHSIEQQRAWYTQMCLGFQQKDTAAVTRMDYAISERVVPVREYLPMQSASSSTVVIYFHGGGFVVGDLNSHDDVCASICTHTGYTTISVDYKLSPEYRHPEAYLDAYAVFSTIARTSKRKIILAGDSAGATLAACVSAHSRVDKIQPYAQVLIYPYLGAPSDNGSYIKHANAPLLSSEDVEFYRKIRIDPKLPFPEDDTFAPLWSDDFTNLPLTRIFSAECDPLCDDGDLYAKKINLAGGVAECTTEVGLVHGYLRARHNSIKAAASFSRILNCIKNPEL